MQDNYNYFIFSKLFLDIPPGHPSETEGLELKVRLRSIEMGSVTDRWSASDRAIIGDIENAELHELLRNAICVIRPAGRFD